MLFKNILLSDLTQIIFTNQLRFLKGINFRVELLPLLFAQVKSPNAAQSKAIAALKSWNLVNSPESVGATIFENWVSTLQSCLWDDEFTTDEKVPMSRPSMDRTIQLIKSHGMKAGVALNPHTPVSLLRDVLPLCDLVCLMSVNPGFGGQKFIENTYNKIIELKAMILELGLNTLIEIDGGVALNNALLLTKAGADVLVAGNTVFGSENPTKTIAELVELTK